MSIDFDKLRQAAGKNQEDSAELALVYNGRTTAMRAYNDRPGKQTADDLNATKREYNETVTRLADKYFPKQTKTDDREFKSQKEARNFLIDQGYKVSVGKFSQDSHQFTTGKGTIVLSELIDYARKELRKTGSLADLAAQREEADTRKAIADADRAEIKRDEERRLLDKNWISRDDSDLEVCVWAALTRDSIVARLDKNLPLLIHVSGGQVDRLAEAQAVIDQTISEACNDIANSGEVNVDIEEIDEAI